MNPTDPLNKPKEDFLSIIERIQADSQVGIDAPLTHAIIIEYLQNIEKRLEKIESKIK